LNITLAKHAPVVTHRAAGAFYLTVLGGERLASDYRANDSVKKNGDYWQLMLRSPKRFTGKRDEPDRIIQCFESIGGSPALTASTKL
jgi:hypothetical protein